MSLGMGQILDRLAARTFAARLYPVLGLFVCLLASCGVLASSFVYFQVVWNQSTVEPTPDRPVAVRNGPYVRYFRQQQFDRWKALERTGWRLLGANIAAYTFAWLLLNAHVPQPRSRASIAPGDAGEADPAAPAGTPESSGTPGRRI
jgi:hypothetical protein